MIVSDEQQVKLMTREAYTKLLALWIELSKQRLPYGITEGKKKAYAKWRKANPIKKDDLTRGIEYKGKF